MCLKISDHTLAETIKFIIASHSRKLNQILTDVQNTDHADYKKYSIIRPRLLAVYKEADAQLYGIRLLVLDHKTALAKIKTAREELHEEWQLHDFNIVALQRPGTKPPFFIKEAA
jgi:hypothetical protein